MSRQIKALEIRAGMILMIYGGTERFDVEQVTANEFGAVIVTDWHGKSRGLSATETVELMGYFNPSGVGVYA